MASTVTRQGTCQIVMDDEGGWLIERRELQGWGAERFEHPHQFWDEGGRRRKMDVREIRKG